MQYLRIKCYKVTNTVALIERDYCMNNSKNPTAIQSQTWIMRALLDLMKHTTYDKISVSEICRKADLDRRTFYRNFDSKNEVLEYYIKILSNEYMEEFRKIDVTDRKEATLLFFEFWGRHISFIQNIKSCGLCDVIFSHFVQFIKEHQDLLMEVDASTVESDYVFAYRIGGFWNVMITWANNYADISPVELSAIVLNA